MERPSQSGGGTSHSVLERISELEREVQILKEQKAGPETYGLARISRSETVTEDDSGLVLSAAENNAGIEGSLAYRIEKINNGMMSLTFNGSRFNGLDGAVQACVDSLPNERNCTYFATIIKNSIFKAIIQKTEDEDYASAIVFGFAINSINYYQKADGEWTVKKIVQ